MAASISAEEVAHRAASDTELIAWVDEQDRPLGSLPRAELCERGLIDRGTFILLFNSAGELCVQCRTLSKAVYPGYWDLATGDMVQAGEPYADSAARELEEELGIHDAVLHGRGHFLFNEPGNRLWYAVLPAVSDALLHLQVGEISETRSVHPELALEEACSPSYCPDSLQVLRLYLDARAADIATSPTNGAFSLLASAHNVAKLRDLSERSPCRPCAAPV